MKEMTTAEATKICDQVTARIRDMQNYLKGSDRVIERTYVTQEQLQACVQILGSAEVMGVALVPARQ